MPKLRERGRVEKRAPVGATVVEEEEEEEDVEMEISEDREDEKPEKIKFSLLNLNMIL
jgi:hypothetical protein